MPQLAELGAKRGAGGELLIPGRNHTNVITSRAFKQGAIEFLGPRPRVVPGTRSGSWTTRGRFERQDDAVPAGA